MIRAVHIVNQFFAGIGGEDNADVPVGAIDGVAGAARWLQRQWGTERKSSRPFISVTTIFTSAKLKRSQRSSLSWKNVVQILSSPARRSTPDDTVLPAWKSARP